MGWAETDHVGLHGPALFFFISYFTSKNEKKSEKKAILVTFPLENIKSFGDDA